MKLAEKGRFQPPPPLPRHAQQVSEAIAGWPQVHARTHWRLGDERVVDGADFYLGQEELGHIHLEAEAHVVLTPGLVDALVGAGMGTRLPWSRSVVVVPITRAAEVEPALWLFRLSYQRRQGEPAARLLAQVRKRAVGAPV